MWTFTDNVYILQENMSACFLSPEKQVGNGTCNGLHLNWTEVCCELEETVILSAMLPFLTIKSQIIMLAKRSTSLHWLEPYISELVGELIKGQAWRL